MATAIASKTIHTIKFSSLSYCEQEIIADTIEELKEAGKDPAEYICDAWRDFMIPQKVIKKEDYRPEDYFSNDPEKYMVWVVLGNVTPEDLAHIPHPTSKQTACKLPLIPFKEICKIIEEYISQQDLPLPPRGYITRHITSHPMRAGHWTAGNPDGGSVYRLRWKRRTFQVYDFLFPRWKNAPIDKPYWGGIMSGR